MDLQPRDFQITWSDVVNSLLVGQVHYWSLLWPVTVSSVEEIRTLQVSRSDKRAFANEFAEIARSYQFELSADATLMAMNSEPSLLATDFVFMLEAGQLRCCDIP